jgi:hypothetical protein
MAKLHEAKVHILHPTQITVGMIEVHDKIREISPMKPHELRDFLAAHPMPAVRRADDQLYITDHHHLGRALWEAGIEDAFVAVEEKLPEMGLLHFWQVMITAHWAHPIDDKGVHQPYTDIPEHVKQLRDDVYRSLAGYVRAAGGFDKTPTPFAEFAWADWFRSRVPVGPSRSDFTQAVDVALKLARTPAARELPGFRGER